MLSIAYGSNTANGPSAGGVSVLNYNCLFEGCLHQPPSQPEKPQSEPALQLPPCHSANLNHTHNIIPCTHSKNAVVTLLPASSFPRRTHDAPLRGCEGENTKHAHMFHKAKTHNNHLPCDRSITTCDIHVCNEPSPKPLLLQMMMWCRTSSPVAGCKGLAGT